MIGIDAHTAILDYYHSEYQQEAKSFIDNLMDMLENHVEKIEHVGSTAIVGIKSKPIIDIAVGVKSLDIVSSLEPILNKNHIYFSKDKLNHTIITYKKEYMGKRTHNIHFVVYQGERWDEFVRFRDILNCHSEIAKKYEDLKVELSKKYLNDVHTYTLKKANFIQEVLMKY